jgi:hypothetical protein
MASLHDRLYELVAINPRVSKLSDTLSSTVYLTIWLIISSSIHLCVCLFICSSMVMHLSVSSCARNVSSTNLFCGQRLCVDPKHRVSQAASQCCVALGATSTHHRVAHSSDTVHNPDLVRLSIFI